jgi:CBS domain-containing protein
MTDKQQKGTSGRWPLTGKTAADLMTRNPVSICETATVEEAVAFLIDTGFSAAPVLDVAGRPVGVLSRTDIVVYDRERLAYPATAPLYFEQADLASRASRVDQTDTPQVRDLMTPAVFSVAPDTPAAEVVEQMVELNVHRLFVVDRDGILVGVISALDLLGHLRP